MSTSTSLPDQPAANQNWRQRKIKVTTKETPELHAFRARYAYLVRRLPKRLQATMFAHILMTDCRTHERRYAKTLMAAYSAVIAPKYKLPAASVASIKRYNLELIELGYITREIFHDSTWDSKGNLRHRQTNSYAVQTMALDMLEIDRGEPITEPITAPTTAPYVVTNVTASRKTESRLKTVSSSRPDDDGKTSSPPGESGSDVVSGADEAVELVMELTGSFIPVNQEVLRRKMAGIAASQDVSMDYIADAINWWSTEGPGSTSRTPVSNRAGHLINSLPGISAQYDDRLAAKKAEDAALLQAEQETTRKQWDHDHTWTGWLLKDSWSVGQYWSEKDRKIKTPTKVSESRPDGDDTHLWLSREEHKRAIELADSREWPKVAVDQMKDICQVAA